MSRRAARALGVTGVVLAFIAPALHAPSTLLRSSVQALSPAPAAVSAAVVMLVAVTLLVVFERHRARDAELRDRTIGAGHLVFILTLWVLTTVVSIVRLADDGYADLVVQLAVVIQVVATASIGVLAAVALRHDRAADRAS